MIHVPVRQGSRIPVVVSGSEVHDDKAGDPQFDNLFRVQITLYHTTHPSDQIPRSYFALMHSHAGPLTYLGSVHLNP